MFKNIENLKITDITKGISVKQSAIACRKTNAFILRISGNPRYIFNDHSFYIQPGDLIFLPKDSCYTLEVSHDTPSEYVSVRFDADLTDATPAAYSFNGFPDYEHFANNLVDLWKFASQSEHYKCYSFFYSILSYIETLENTTYPDKKKLGLLAPAIDYLKANIYSPSLNIKYLHQLCGISGTYFRKIFKANFACSPQKYILSKRLSHAKTLLDNDDYYKISELALSVGYTDALYFSRAFKKLYGISPSEYAKKH